MPANKVAFILGRCPDPGHAVAAELWEREIPVLPVLLDPTHEEHESDPQGRLSVFAPRIFSWDALRANLRCLVHQPARCLSTWGIALVEAACAPAALLENLAAVWKAAALVERLPEGEVRQIHAEGAAGTATAAWAAARLSGLPFSFTARGDTLFPFRRRYALERKAQAAEFVVARSGYVKDLLIWHCGAQVSEKVFVVYEGAEWRDGAFGESPSSSLDFLAAGPLTPSRGLEDLVDAARILKEAGVPVRGRIVGEGELSDSLRQRIEKAGVDLEVEDRSSRSLRAEEYREARLFILPCTSQDDGAREEIPEELLRAMAFGIPILATHAAGVPEVVRHFQSGLLIPQSSPYTLARGIRYLLDREPLRRRFAERAGSGIRSLRRDESADRLAQMFREGLPSAEPAPVTEAPGIPVPAPDVVTQPAASLFEDAPV